MANGAASADMVEDGRREALAVLARADREELERAWEAWPDRPGFALLRAPEIGLAMVRGRIGGGGAPFNLGEVTVTRAAVRLATGAVGFGHVLGRDRDKARLVAIFDALWMTRGTREQVEAAVIGPVRERLAEAAARTRRQTAATRVNFFTLVRGEDE